jgi:hypothetical protein
MEAIDKKITLNFGVWVHTLPDDLKNAPPPTDEDDLDTAEVYSFLISSRLIWQIYLIDEWGGYWIGFRRMENGNVSSHGIRIDPGTYEEFEIESYEVIDQRKN